MKKATKYILIGLVLLSVFIWAKVAKSPYDPNCHVYVLDVGQGDSILIQKGEYQILVDGGPDDKVLSEIGKVMPIGDRKIETVVLTHPHADHLTGLNLILDRYEIGTIYSTGVVHTSNVYLEFLAKIKDKKLNYKVPEIGGKIEPFLNGDIEFLWPGKTFVEQKIDNLNNASEVSKFCYFTHCILLTGDIETDEQETMFEKTENKEIFQSEILKVSHHGSVNGTNQKLIDMVKPKFAAISVGADNQFGHPHAATIDLLNKNNIEIYRTDRDGTIEFVLGENGITEK